MRATVFHGAHDVRVETVPDPTITAPTDAIVRVTHACICGSDLWPYRGIAPWKPGFRLGHEFIGVVEDVGKSVTSVKRGDRVIAPFSYSDGTCEFCKKGLHTSCVHAGFWGGADDDGGQGEGVRVPFADGTLVPIPGNADNDPVLLTRLLPLTDVMGTGHHAAVAAGVGKGSTVAVVGDGAVGLCGVLAARRLGAERIIAMGHHEKRLDLAKRFGATDVVTERGEDAAKAVQALTNGGAASVLECVGTADSMAIAFNAARPGGTVGFVGVPHGEITLRRAFGANVALRGGVAPVRAYIEELMRDVLAGYLDPSPVFDKTVGVEAVPEGYRAMDERTALKVQVTNGL